MVNSFNFVLNFIAGFLEKTFISTLCGHTENPAKGSCKRQELGIDGFAEGMLWDGFSPASSRDQEGFSGAAVYSRRLGLAR